MKKLDQKHLDKLAPFNQLPVGDRHRLLQVAEIREYMAGEKLFANDTEDYLVYLLDGRIDYCLSYHQAVLIRDTDEEALNPLFKLGEELDAHIVTQSVTRLVFFSRAFLNKLTESELLVSESAGQRIIDPTSQALYNEIYKLAESGKLRLPSLPEIAVRVKKAVAEEDVDADQVVRIIESDPAMVARLIQVANGPLARGYESINSIRDAVVRLGLKMTQNLVVGLALKQLFRSKTPLLKKRMQKLYVHSIEVAAIAFALSRRTRQLSADEALLAGLIHDIGIVPLLEYMDITGLELENESDLERILDGLRTSVGSLVVKNWGFSGAFINVVEQAENWSRDSRKPVDLADLVNIAQIYHFLQRKDVKRLPTVKHVPACEKMFPGKGHDQTFAMSVLDDAKHEIEQIKQVLGL